MEHARVHELSSSRARESTARDLYSLALITFNMLTGAAPFSGTSISAW
jgi:serine/threonine protein kinase